MAKKTTTTSSSTAPAVKEVAKRVGKTKHLLQGNKDSKIYPFPALPTDYDFLKNSSLKSKDFATKAAFFDYQAALLTFKAAEMTKKAESERSMPADKESKAEAKRLERLLKSVTELQTKLKGKSVDTSAIEARVKAQMEAVTAAKA